MSMFQKKRFVNRVFNKIPTPPTSFVDSFIRANSNPMSTTASDGGTWIVGPGALVDCQIMSNLCRYTAADSGAVVASPTFTQNHFATHVLGNGGSGVMLRVQSGTDCACYLIIAESGTVVRVYKMDSALGKVQLGSHFSTSGYTTLGASITGTSTVTIEVFIDGVSVGTRTDSTSPLTGGQPGIYLGNFSSCGQFNANDI